MTEQVQISKITIGERQRKELRGISELRSSIARYGQLQPIILTRNNELVAGERRLTACKELGFDTIEAKYTDELDQWELHLIEFEENIRREDLTWQEKCTAIAKYHEYRLELNEEWTHNDTAQELGYSVSSIDGWLSVSERLARPEVANAEKFSTAKNIVRRQKDREAAAVIETLTTTSEPQEKPVAPGYVLNKSFHEWVKDYSGPRFNFIHCDFPYGINADKMDQVGASHDVKYADTPEVYRELLKTFVDYIDVFCADSAHLMFWFSMDYYKETLDALRSTGFVIYNHPLIWTKQNRGVIPNPRYEPRRTYETAFFGHRGERPIVRSVNNHYGEPRVGEDGHMSHKDSSMLRHFFSMFIDTTSTVLDPTCGSGSALGVARQMGAYRILGLEIDPTHAATAERLIGGDK